MREIAAVIRSGHTFKQKMNYLKSRYYPKGEVLAYNPVTISIVATGRCTLSCNMCPTHSASVPKDYQHIQKNVRDMDFDMFRRIIDSFSDALTVHIIGSGEPLLNKDLFRMIDYAAKKGMTVKSFSNGTTIKENIGNILNSRLDGITISINGYNAEEFSRMTGVDGAIYHKIYDAVKELMREKKKSSSKVKVKLSFIIDRQNYKFIPAMIDLSMGLGVDHAFFCNFLASPYGSLTADERTLRSDDKMKNELKSIFAAYPPRIRKKLTPPILIDCGPGPNRCGSHFSQIRFDGEGNVSSCSMMLLNMTGHGSYTEKGVWNNNFFMGMRKIFLSNDSRDLPEPCRVCPDNKGLSLDE